MSATCGLPDTHVRACIRLAAASIQARSRGEPRLAAKTAGFESLRRAITSPRAPGNAGRGRAHAGVGGSSRRARTAFSIRDVRREPGCATFTAYEARDTPGRLGLHRRRRAPEDRPRTCLHIRHPRAEHQRTRKPRPAQRDSRPGRGTGSADVARYLGRRACPGRPDRRAPGDVRQGAFSFALLVSRWLASWR